MVGVCLSMTLFKITPTILVIAGKAFAEQNSRYQSVKNTGNTELRLHTESCI